MRLLDFNLTCTYIRKKPSYIISGNSLSYVVLLIQNNTTKFLEIFDNLHVKLEGFHKDEKFSKNTGTVSYIKNLIQSQSILFLSSAYFLCLFFAPVETGRFNEFMLVLLSFCPSVSLYVCNLFILESARFFFFFFLTFYTVIDIQKQQKVKDPNMRKKGPEWTQKRLFLSFHKIYYYFLLGAPKLKDLTILFFLVQTPYLGKFCSTSYRPK